MWKRKKKKVEEPTSSETFMEGILTEEDFLDADEADGREDFPVADYYEKVEVSDTDKEAEKKAAKEAAEAILKKKKAKVTEKTAKAEDKKEAIKEASVEEDESNSTDASAPREATSEAVEEIAAEEVLSESQEESAKEEAATEAVAEEAETEIQAQEPVTVEAEAQEEEAVAEATEEALEARGSEDVKAEAAEETEAGQADPEASGTEEKKDEKEASEEEKKADTKEDVKADDEAADGEDEAEPKKTWKIILAVFFGLVLAVYGGISVYFMSHFFPYTVLNGVDVSMYTAAQVEEIQEQKVSEYILKMVESDGDVTIINGKEIDLTYEKDGKVKKIMKTQNPFLWVTCFWKESVLNEKVSISYDVKKLSEVIDDLDCMDEKNQVPSVSAHPEYNGEKFEIVEGEIGTQIQRNVFVKAIKDTIEAIEPELDLIEAGCYTEAEYGVDDPKVEQACQEMNDYLGAEITYDLTPYTEVVDGAVISTWLSCDKNMEVTFSQEKLKAYVALLAETYDTYGKTRQFVTGYGDTVEVVGGSFGWKIDQAAEIEALIANIQNKEVVTREPVYTSRGVSHEENDIGNTYAEVDLTRQHMFYFQNGQLMMESDIVTGNPSAGNATPQGVYSLAYKQMDATLRGPQKEDGTYEWESPVKYWMPFNGGIGFHDATWQASFGGSRYTVAGSHGCINMPYDAAGQLYDLIQAGVPVVCHY